MRTFIALELPEAFADEVAAMARRLALSCEGRFVRRETYHVTLAFLGDINEAVSHDAVGALEEACVGRGAVPLRSEGLGTFGRPHDATLWLGLAAAPELVGLASSVRECLAACGVAFEDKPFRPHVTLGRRVRLPRADLPSLAFPLPDEAVRATLFKSILEPDGARYKPLHTVELASEPRP